MNVNEADAPPPGAGLVTVTCAEPTVAISLARIEAVSCVLLTNVVGRVEPFHCTVVLETKPVPVTVNVKPDPPVVAEEGESMFSWGAGLLPLPPFEPLEQPDASVTAVQASSRRMLFDLITPLRHAIFSVTEADAQRGHCRFPRSGSA